MHWRKKWQPIPVFLPGKFHGHRNLVGSSPWGRKESDTVAHTCTHSYFMKQWEFQPVQTTDHFLVVLYKKGKYSGTKRKLGVDVGKKFHILPNTVFLIGEFRNVGYV